jgi:hypothetical protein
MSKWIEEKNKKWFFPRIKRIVLIFYYAVLLFLFLFNTLTN